MTKQQLCVNVFGYCYSVRATIFLPNSGRRHDPVNGKHFICLATDVKRVRPEDPIFEQMTFTLLKLCSKIVCHDTCELRHIPFCIFLLSHVLNTDLVQLVDHSFAASFVTLAINSLHTDHGNRTDIGLSGVNSGSQNILITSFRVHYTFVSFSIF
jgi:hypothetical protein